MKWVCNYFLIRLNDEMTHCGVIGLFYIELLLHALRLKMVEKKIKNTFRPVLFRAKMEEN